MRLHLGPAYSWPTTRCQENLALPVIGILTRLRCYYHQDLQWVAVHRTSRPYFYPPSTPTYRTQLSLWPKVSATSLSPVHFRGPQARKVSCYALFKGWLLLSLPPCCLRSETPFCLTLSWYLGALTLVWVAPLLVMRLTPHKPASGLLPYQHIRSLKRWWALSDPCHQISALQRWQRLPGLDSDLFRWELAITRLDWLLAPCPESGD